MSQIVGGAMSVVFCFVAAFTCVVGAWVEFDYDCGFSAARDGAVHSV